MRTSSELSSRKLDIAGIEFAFDFGSTYHFGLTNKHWTLSTEKYNLIYDRHQQELSHRYYIEGDLKQALEDLILIKLSEDLCS